MLNKKKYVMPDTTGLEGAGPQVAELVVFTKALTHEVNAAHQEVLALEAEVARLKKAKKREQRRSK